MYLRMHHDTASLRVRVMKQVSWERGRAPLPCSAEHRPSTLPTQTCQSRSPNVARERTHRFPHDASLNRLRARKQNLNRRQGHLRPLRLGHPQKLGHTVRGLPSHAPVHLLQPRYRVGADARALTFHHELLVLVMFTLTRDADLDDGLHESRMALVANFGPASVLSSETWNELDLCHGDGSASRSSVLNVETLHTVTREKFQFSRMS